MISTSLESDVPEPDLSGSRSTRACDDVLERHGVAYGSEALERTEETLTVVQRRDAGRARIAVIAT
jgi:hypothetical protein